MFFKNFLVYHKTRIIRSCGYIEQPDQKKRENCYKQTITEATETTYCECDTDYCNNSGRLKTSVGLLTALVVIVGWVRVMTNCSVGANIRQ